MSDKINFAELALLEDELYDVQKAAGQEKELTGLKKLIDRYFIWQEERQLHQVDKKRYLLLSVFLGWMGIHRFYERRWMLGIFYLSLCWTGFPIALAFVDILIAIPKQADENGCISI